MESAAAAAAALETEEWLPQSEDETCIDQRLCD